MGVAERLGIDCDTLSSYNPRLIYAHASSYGPKGPDKDDPSFDYAVLARSGIMSLVGYPDMEPALQITGDVADQAGAMSTVFGILAALFVRERTGVSQKVDASLLGSVSFLLGQPITLRCIMGVPSARLSRKSAGNPLWSHYKCGDGKWIVMAHLQSDRYWPGVCRAMGLEELQEDARFNTMDNRSNNQELVAILDRRFATKTRDEWTKIFKEKGLIASPVNTILELIGDPQALANDYVTEFNHPVFGRTKMPGFPLGFSKTPCSIRREAPELGQHTEEILTEILGYSRGDIAKLKAEGVI
jgi:crotonobetainyl-CoA:carnitine CoA-transferase CaiB-like acyl-CoA transferase